MRLHYLPVGGTLKPALDIVATHAGQRLSIRAIVDSGADFCVFDLEIATELNIAIDRSAGVNVRGIGGQIVVYPGQLDIELRGRNLPLRVFFAPNLPMNLLGRDNFFHYFVVQFDEINHELKLLTRRRSQSS